MSATKVASKAIIFTAQAQEHHTQVKIKSVLKWIKTGYEVKVQISGTADRQKAMDSILKEIESNVKSGAKIKQKQVKPDSIKFFLIPSVRKGGGGKDIVDGDDPII